MSWEHDYRKQAELIHLVLLELCLCGQIPFTILFFFSSTSFLTLSSSVSYPILTALFLFCLVFFFFFLCSFDIFVIFFSDVKIVFSQSFITPKCRCSFLSQFPSPLSRICTAWWAIGRLSAFVKMETWGSNLGRSTETIIFVKAYITDLHSFDVTQKLNN